MPNRSRCSGVETVAGHSALLAAAQGCTRFCTAAAQCRVCMFTCCCRAEDFFGVLHRCDIFLTHLRFHTLSVAMFSATAVLSTVTVRASTNWNSCESFFVVLERCLQTTVHWSIFVMSRVCTHLSGRIFESTCLSCA